jgi:hypothetical protein
MGQGFEKTGVANENQKNRNAPEAVKLRDISRDKE